METNDLINPLLVQIQKECDEIKTFIDSADFPYHKVSSYDRIVKHASAILLLSGEIKALHKLQDHDITENEYFPSIIEIVQSLSDCRIEI